MYLLLSRWGRRIARVERVFYSMISARAVKLVTADEVKVNRSFGGCLPAVYLSRSLQTNLRGNSYDKIGEKGK